MLSEDIIRFKFQEDRFCCYFRGIFQNKIAQQDNNKFSYSYLDGRRLEQTIRRISNFQMEEDSRSKSSESEAKKKGSSLSTPMI